MHGQAQHLAAQAFADRQRAGALAPGTVGRLQVHRQRVVDRGRDALRGKRRPDLVAPLQPDRVLRPGRAAAGQPRRQSGDSGKPCVVARRDPLTRVDLGIEDRQLDHQDGRLEGVEAAVEADADDVVLALALAVLADRAPARRQRRVVGEERAAVAVAAERLGRVEAGRGDRRQCADGPAAARAPETLGRVVDQQHPPLRRERRERLVVRRLAEQVRRDHRLRRELPLRRHMRDARREFGGVDHVGLLHHIDEDRRGTSQRHHLRRRGEGEARDEDRVACADPVRHQRDQEGVAAARAGDRFGRAGACCKRRLQLGHRRPHDVAAVLQHMREGGVDLPLEAPVLCAQVDEGDGVAIGRGHGTPSSSVAARGCRVPPASIAGTLSRQRPFVSLLYHCDMAGSWTNPRSCDPTL